MVDRGPGTASEEILHLLERFFETVSFSSGQTPAYKSIRGLFVGEGLLVGGNTESVTARTVEDFIAVREEAFANGRLTEFSERELAGRTITFGNMAHRMSRYEKRGVLDDTPFSAVGIISTQFARTADSWRMIAMVWDDERSGLSIPKDFLEDS